MFIKTFGSESLTGRAEFGNIHDPYAVAVVNLNDTTVGHLPRNISALCHIFLRRTGNILVQVTGRRQRSIDLPQGGLEVPCTLTLVGGCNEISKIENLISLSPVNVSAIDIEPPSKQAKVDIETEGNETALNKVMLFGWDLFDTVGQKHINYAQ